MTKLPTAELVLAIHGSNPTDVFASTLSTLHHFDGTQWSPVRADGRLRGAYATPTHVYFAEPGTHLRRLSRPTPW